ncbi:deoxyxylulose-5-phosphate synthase [Streptomyces sp. B-S-A6]|uniref:Deoxyxylulose-5-phosphate synthase n=2 Tax=Streptomyces cavernicola TaxID=3043613 RepID=A0ABT6SH88_9ACTN|nr:deoxyxylulose-5-phosphate synthase [Streptomyces sp. B-S-A6]MDI3407533.1 deoxyxylulose-5-phosphate synthase [Streptomyces sp. B-S-A6]
MVIMRSHLVCLGCRHAFKKASPQPVPCPSCGEPMIDAGEQLAVPPRRDVDGWRALAVVLEAGLRFRPTCGCMPDGPGYRPRTLREVRERQEVAARTGRPLAEVLADPDPWSDERRD